MSAAELLRYLLYTTQPELVVGIAFVFGSATTFALLVLSRCVGGSIAGESARTDRGHSEGAQA